jgi:hypothetical protein
MIGAGIDQGGKSKLPDAPEPLKIGMLYQIEQQSGIQIDETPYRIIDNFTLVLLHKGKYLLSI